MNKLLLVVLLLLSLVNIEANFGWTHCGKYRAKSCTLEYSPVCGATVNGGQRRFSNKCLACSHIWTYAYRPGHC